MGAVISNGLVISAVRLHHTEVPHLLLKSSALSIDFRLRRVDVASLASFPLVKRIYTRHHNYICRKISHAAVKRILFV